MKWAIALTTALILSLSVMATGCSQSSTIEGVVDHKVLSGIKDGTQYGIVFNAPDEDGTPLNQVKHDAFRRMFPLHGELVVSEDAENQMRAVYSDFVCQVSVTTSPDDAFGYLTTQEIFNRMSLGAAVKCRVSGLRILKIVD